MQINEYPITATILKDEYLFDIDALISTSPDVWQSQKVPWKLITDSVPITVGTTNVASGTNNRALRIEGGKLGQSDYAIPKVDGTSGQVLMTNGAGIASWQTIATGITIGTTTITSGTDNRVLFQASGKVSQDAGFNFNPTNKTLWNNGKGGLTSNNSFGENALGSNTTGTTNSAFGYNAGRLITTGSNNTIFGYQAGGSILASNFTGNDNTLIGAGAGAYLTSGIQNTFIGNNAGVSITTGSYNTIIGMNGTSFPSGFVQNVVISDGSGQVALWKNSSNYVGFGFNPVSDTLAAKVDVKLQGALSADIGQRWLASNGTTQIGKITGDGAFTFGAYTNTNTRLSVTNGTGTAIYATGAGTAGYFQNEAATGTAYAAQFLGRQYGSGSPSGYTAFGILTGADTSNGINYGLKSYAYNGATNYAAYLDSAAGTTNWALYIQRGDILLGSATTNKIAFWNKTPIVQPTTAIAGAAFVTGGGGTNMKTDDTFGGYTLQQIAAALINIGILA